MTDQNISFFSLPTTLVVITKITHDDYYCCFPAADWPSQEMAGLHRYTTTMDFNHDKLS